MPIAVVTLRLFIFPCINHSIEHKQPSLARDFSSIKGLKNISVGGFFEVHQIPARTSTSKMCCMDDVHICYALMKITFIGASLSEPHTSVIAL